MNLVLHNDGGQRERVSTEIQSALAEGNWDAARQGYEFLWRQNNSDDEVLAGLKLLDAIGEGEARMAEGCYALAADAFMRAVTICPELFRAHNLLGNAFLELGQYAKAGDCYVKSIELNPEYAPGYCNIGSVYYQLGNLDRAVENYLIALRIRPDFRYVMELLGDAYTEMAKYHEAEAIYKRALDIDPAASELQGRLGFFYLDRGDYRSAIVHLSAAVAINRRDINALSAILFCFCFIDSCTPSKYLEHARQYERMVTQGVKPFDHASRLKRPKPDRLRVGFVSGDFSDHPVGYFIETVLQHFDKTRVEVVAYYTFSGRSGALTDRIRSMVDTWHVVEGTSDIELALLIQREQVDILVDLSGHTAYNRLPIFAYKPAPVQVSWLGYFASTGMSAIDYIITDPVTSPTEAESHFTEKLWRLPYSRLCFSPPRLESSAPVAPSPFFINGYVTFGCFQRYSKINEVMVSAWADILKSTPSSKMVLKGKGLQDEQNKQGLLSMFLSYGIEGDRLLIEGNSDRLDYFKAYHRVDMMLDTFPFPGGTTTCEALWMGVPTLTLAGDTMLKRQGAGLLTAAGLSEWVAGSRDAYIRKGITLANSLSAWAGGRVHLRARVEASPLMDAARFAEDIEQAFQDMWSKFYRQAESS